MSEDSKAEAKVTRWSLEDLDELKKEASVSKGQFTRATKPVITCVQQVESRTILVNKLITTTLADHMKVLEAKYDMYLYWLQSIIFLTDIDSSVKTKYQLQVTETDTTMDDLRNRAMTCYSMTTKLAQPIQSDQT